MLEKQFKLGKVLCDVLLKHCWLDVHNWVQLEEWEKIEIGYIAESLLENTPENELAKFFFDVTSEYDWYIEKNFHLVDDQTKQDYLVNRRMLPLYPKG
jgi:hypothetical protein